RHGNRGHELPPQNPGRRTVVVEPTGIHGGVVTKRTVFAGFGTPIRKSEPRGGRRSRDSAGPTGGAIRECYETAPANFSKNWSAIFFAAPFTSRCPSCASLPPICASTW